MREKFKYIIGLKSYAVDSDRELTGIANHVIIDGGNIQVFMGAELVLAVNDYNYFIRSPLV